jgi:uncharacterized protein (TIGR02246 family)
MKRFAFLVSALSVIFLVAPCTRLVAQARNEKVEQEVIHVEDERMQAFKSSDSATLNRIFDDDFTFTNVNGEVHTKAELIGDVTSGKLKYNELNHSEIRVRVYDNTAILTGRSASVYIDGGKEGGRTPRRYMNIYIRKNGQWRLVARQETPVLGK